MKYLEICSFEQANQIFDTLKAPAENFLDFNSFHRGLKFSSDIFSNQTSQAYSYKFDKNSKNNNVSDFMNKNNFHPSSQTTESKRPLTTNTPSLIRETEKTRLSNIHQMIASHPTNKNILSLYKSYIERSRSSHTK